MKRTADKNRCLISDSATAPAGVQQTAHLSAVSPPLAVAGLGGSDGDHGWVARHTVAPALAQEGP